MDLRHELKIDPLPALLDLGDEALTYFLRRDLLCASIPEITTRWTLPEPVRLVKRQRTDGSWKYAGKVANRETGQNYTLLESFRNLRLLVGFCGFTHEPPGLKRVAECIFSCQSPEGDIRGILGNQYMPYYHGAMLELLVKADICDDPRLELGLEWLLDMRQADGGWIVPAQADDALWPTAYTKGRKALRNRCWVGLAACRVLKRYALDSGLGENV